MPKHECIFCDEDGWAIETMPQETIKLCASVLVLMKICPSHAEELKTMIEKREAERTAA